MKNKIIAINREDWDNLREFRKIPFKKRYLEMLELEEFLKMNLRKKLQELN